MPTESHTLSPEAAPSPAPSPTGGLTPMLTGAAFAPVPDLAFIQIAGEDRVRWLNGMTTNSIQTLTPGQGCYTFFLNAQGRIQADATAWLLEDSILLQTSRDRVPALIAHLDRFIIMDDVELRFIEHPSSLSSHPPVSSSRGEAAESASLTLIGPQSTAILQKLGLIPGQLPPMRCTESRWAGALLWIFHVHSPLVDRYVLHSNGDSAFDLLPEALANAGATPATPSGLEALRLLEGTPLYATDIRERDLPQETGQTHALHFAKGCYLGQEIVERIRSRGNVHRTLSGFALAGPIPSLPAPLFAAEAPEKILGELTSAARIQLPTGSIALALGIVRREALEKNTEIRYENGSATPIKLPYPL